MPPEGRNEPLFICDDEKCAPGVCSLAGVVPEWMRPYRCQYLSDGDRRARDIVFRWENPDSEFVRANVEEGHPSLGGNDDDDE